MVCRPPGSTHCGFPNSFSGGQADAGRAVGPIPVCGSPVSTQLAIRFSEQDSRPELLPFSYATAPGLRASFRERSTSSSGTLGRRFDRVVGWSCNCQLSEPAQARVLPPRSGRGGRGRRNGSALPGQDWTGRVEEHSRAISSPAASWTEPRRPKRDVRAMRQSRRR